MKKIYVYITCLVALFSTLNGAIHFLHIPKCAGTTLRSLLEKNFHENDIYPLQRFFIEKHNYSEAPLIEHEFVAGHFPFWFLKEKDPNFEASFLFTVFRDPVERVLSHARYRQKHGSDAFFDPLSIMPNWMCKMLTSDPNLKGQELLEDCISNLIHFDYILFQDDPEKFELGIKLLFKALQFPYLDKDVPRLNPTKKNQVSEELIEKLKELNSLDIALYQFAKNHFLSQKKYRPNPRNVTAQSEIIHTFDMPMNGYGWHRRENLRTGKAIYQNIRNQKGVIYFSLVPGKDYILTCNAKVFRPDIKLSLEINGSKLKLRKEGRGAFVKYRAFIPKKLITQNETEIVFCTNKQYYVPDVKHGSNDMRYLSCALNRLQISPKR